MMKISRNDVQGGLTIIAASFVILASMHLLPHTTPANASISSQLRQEVMQTITPINMSGVSRKILNSSGKQTFLMIYTSWCPYCRKAIPSVINWKQNGLLGNTQLIMLSTDEKPEDLYSYLGANEYHKTLPSYLYKPASKYEMSSFVSRYNLSYKGGIPYGAVFDKQGKLIAESTSGGGWNDINALMGAESY